MKIEASRFIRIASLLAGILLSFAAIAQNAPPPNTPPASSPAVEDDIRGPRDAVDIPVPDAFSPTPWIVGIAALAVAAALLIWRRKRRRRRRDPGPVDRALGALEELDRERNAVEAASLADRAADVVRRFIAEKFGIAAPQRTTEEFLHAISNDPASTPGAHSALLRGFLKSCDMAKFAGADFDAAERLELLANAFRFVREAASPAAGPAVQGKPETA